MESLIFILNCLILFFEIKDTFRSFTMDNYMPDDASLLLIDLFNLKCLRLLLTIRSVEVCSYLIHS